MTTAIYWTKEVVDAMREGSLADYEKKCTEQLSEIVQLVRGKLSKLNRATLSALAVMDVHARDVVGHCGCLIATSAHDLFLLQNPCNRFC